jgi:hypothetical protein
VRVQVVEGRKTPAMYLTVSYILSCLRALPSTYFFYNKHGGLVAIFPSCLLNFDFFDRTPKSERN